MVDVGEELKEGTKELIRSKHIKLMSETQKRRGKKIKQESKLP